MKRLLGMILGLAVLVGCNSQESALPDAVVKVGDSPAAADKTLLAAGAEQVFRPTAPLDIAPLRILVDESGQTNIVKTTPSLVFTRYYELKDGRELVLRIHEDKVTSVDFRKD